MTGVSVDRSVVSRMYLDELRGKERKERKKKAKKEKPRPKLNSWPFADSFDVVPLALHTCRLAADHQHFGTYYITLLLGALSRLNYIRYLASEDFRQT